MLGLIKKKKKKKDRERETRERITALSFKRNTKTRKEKPENEKKNNWKKMNDDTKTVLLAFFSVEWFIVLFFICSFELLFFLLINVGEGKVLDYMIVRDYKIGKEENKEKQKENPFTSIY